MFLLSCEGIAINSLDIRPVVSILRKSSAYSVMISRLIASTCDRLLVSRYVFFAYFPNKIGVFVVAVLFC